MGRPVVGSRLSPLAASRRNPHVGRARIAAASAAVLCSLSLFPPGCDRGQDATLFAPRPTVPAGEGVITGTVRLLGPAPGRRPLPGADCHSGGPPLTDELVVADDEGRLANVVVYVKDGPPVAAPADPVVMDQANCRFEPHVVAVRTGQTLRFHSSDPTLHNVHGTCEANPPFNLAMGAAGQSSDTAFRRPETFRVKCDVHPWMSGWVAVFDHPLFAVTRGDGGFSIKGLPPGTYSLVAWQERYGQREQAVTVPANPAAPAAAPPIRADFDYGAVK